MCKRRRSPSAPATILLAIRITRTCRQLVLIFQFTPLLFLLLCFFTLGTICFNSVALVVPLCFTRYLPTHLLKLSSNLSICYCTSYLLHIYRSYSTLSMDNRLYP